jgi:hypothetical protein
MEIQENSSSRETCLGLPFVEERQLNDEECAALENEGKMSRRNTWGLGCASPFVFIFSLFLMASVSPASSAAPPAEILPGVVIVIAGLVAGAACFLKANDRSKINKYVKQELRNGAVRRYRGHLPGVDKNHVFEDPNFSAPGHLADVTISAYDPLTIDVLCGSRRLWLINGVRAKRLVLLAEETTAFQPEQAKIAAKWAEPARISGHTIDISGSSQRDLSLEEGQEIRRCSRTAWRKTGIISFLLTAYFGAAAIAQLHSGSPVHLKPIAFYYFAILLFCNYKFIKLAIWCYRLHKDAERGIAIVTRFPDQMNGDELVGKGKVMEWLPFSKYKWTINGEPAPWRLRG